MNDAFPPDTLADAAWTFFTTMPTAMIGGLIHTT